MLNPFSSSIIFKEYTKNSIINGFITAALFSAFIYLEYFEINYKLLNTILVLI